jgi:hypothetical protein
MTHQFLLIQKESHIPGGIFFRLLPYLRLVADSIKDVKSAPIPFSA